MPNSRTNTPAPGSLLWGRRRRRRNRSLLTEEVLCVALECAGRQLPGPCRTPQAALPLTNQLQENKNPALLSTGLRGWRESSLARVAAVGRDTRGLAPLGFANFSALYICKRPAWPWMFLFTNVSEEYELVHHRVVVVRDGA